MKGTIKQRLDEGKIVRVMIVGGVPHPKLVEAAGIWGNLHGVWLDQEHCNISHSDLETLAMACRAAGLDAFSRVAPTDYATVMRPMEAGCSGVLAAQVRTQEDVEQVVSWSKYPPIGTRGAYTSNAECLYGKIGIGEQVETANRDRWLGIQIETLEAAEIVDQIAAIDGVDWLFVGPADMSVALGVPGQFVHQKCLEVLDKVSSACQKAEIPWGTLATTLEYGQACRDRGCQLFALYSDLGCYRTGIAAMEETFADFMD